MGVLLPAPPTSTRSTRELCFRISDFLYYYFEQLDQDLPPGRSFYDHMAYSEPESTQDFYPPLLLLQGLLLLLPTPSTSTSSRFTAVSTHPSYCYYTAYSKASFLTYLLLLHGLLRVLTAPPISTRSTRGHLPGPTIPRLMELTAAFIFFPYTAYSRTSIF